MARSTRYQNRNTGDNIQLEYERRIDQDYVNNMPITLRCTTGIYLTGDNRNFEWEGTHNGQTIRVILPRHASEYDAQIENLPNEWHPERGHLRDQVFDEIHRILRQLN